MFTVLLRTVLFASDAQVTRTIKCVFTQLQQANAIISVLIVIIDLIIHSIDVRNCKLTFPF